MDYRTACLKLCNLCVRRYSITIERDFRKEVPQNIISDYLGGKGVRF